ncbi:MAG: ATP-binding protein [Ferruginibacter sp.]
MNYWSLYIMMIRENCTHAEHGKGLGYWRDNLFAGTIIYMLPFSLIALVPGLYWSFILKMYSVAAIDILTVIGMALVGFVPSINLGVRKFIFICCLYTFSIAILYYLGLQGPGLLYLLAACILSIFIFPAKFAFWPVWLNTFICISFAIAIWYNIIPRTVHNRNGADEWMVVTANLIFLSFFSAALIPRLFKGLQETVDKEKLLKEELSNKQRSLEQALDMLQQKNNELEQFAYTVSHDLKEPLRMVTSFMGILKKNYEKELDQKALSFISFAIDGGVRMQQMINGLLELSRTGRQETDREMVDLNEVLKEVEQNIYKLIEETGATIVVPKPLPVLCAYRADISRLFQNLLSNAIKFRKKDIGPIIKLNVVENESDWEFGIEDNGIGMHPKNYERIFDVFTRLHSQTSYEGTGIGLAICKKIVEQGGGRIRVEAEEGKGSTFCFSLKKDMKCC